MVKNGLSEQKFGMFQPKVENRDVEFEKSIPSQWSHPAPGDSPSHNTVFCHHDVVFQRPIRYDSLRKLWGEYTGRFYCIRSTKAGTQQERLFTSLTNVFLCMLVVGIIPCLFLSLVFLHWSCCLFVVLHICVKWCCHGWFVVLMCLMCLMWMPGVEVILAILMRSFTRPP